MSDGFFASASAQITQSHKSGGESSGHGGAGVNVFAGLTGGVPGFGGVGHGSMEAEVSASSSGDSSDNAVSSSGKVRA